jgi:hypothetical protein
MTNTLKFSVNEQEIDSDNNISDERNFDFEKDFTKYQKGEISLTSGTTYTTINFNGMTGVTSLRVNTDQSINSKINGGTEVFVINKDVIWNGTFTALSLNNASGTTCTVIYELYQ